MFLGLCNFADLGSKLLAVDVKLVYFLDAKHGDIEFKIVF